MSATRVLIIDDEANMRHFLQALLVDEGYEAICAMDGQEGLEALRSQSVDMVLCDMRMPGMDGMRFLEQLQAQAAPLPLVIMMSAYGTIDMAIEAMRNGAYDYVSKPFKPAEILLALRKAEERQSLERQNRQLRRQIAGAHQCADLVGKSKPMQDLFDLIGKVAAFSTAVLILGESGTGKELVARAVHQASPRCEQPFVAVNCGAIPETLLESELFGHRRGAFTGADHERPGLFEEAGGGTLFLDEIGDLPAAVQGKLLRALQDGEIRRIGDDAVRHVDVRVLAATSRDLPLSVAQGGFREDLYYRLHVLPLHVPPLRSRPEDIPLLVTHFIDMFNIRHGLQIEGVDAGAMGRLMRYAWPGNVRELQHVIERMMVLTERPLLTGADVPAGVCDAPAVEPTGDGQDLSVKRQTRELERRLICAALERTGGNRRQAARLLELSYPSLLSKITQYAIAVPGNRS